MRAGFRTIGARHRAIQPLEDMEVALVRSHLECPGWLSEREESGLRYALSLARLTQVRTTDGRDVDLTELTHPLRERLTETLSPLLLDHRGLVQRHEIAALTPIILDLARDYRDRLKAATLDLLPWSDIEQEISEKLLVLACGGGGGTGYVYLGVFQALEERGIVPALLTGTSIGAVLGAFRARRRSFEVSEVPNVVRTLSWGLLFRPKAMRSRYGLPAPLRLHLHEGVGRHFSLGEGERMRISDLAIPLLVATAGIRAGEPLDEPAWHEDGFNLDLPEERSPAPGLSRKLLTMLIRAFQDLSNRQDALRSVILGGDAVTRSYDLLDAVGFSSAVPGLIQYDLQPGESRMSLLLDELFERKQIRRLLDGALVDNVPAKAAWRAVHSGQLRRRNALVVALDAFAPKLTQPLWLPIQRLARPNVVRNLRYAHIIKPFTHTLSPATLVPGPAQISKAIQWGREEFAHEMPLIERLLTPILPLV